MKLNNLVIQHITGLFSKNCGIPLLLFSISFMKTVGFLLFIFSLNLYAQNAEIQLALNSKHAHDVTLETSDKTYTIATLGTDPYLFTNALKTQLDKQNTKLAFEYFCPQGLDFIEVHFYPMRKNLKPKLVKDVGATEGWVSFTIDLEKALTKWGAKGDFLRLDFGSVPGVNLQIRNLVLRPQTLREAELEKNKEEKLQKEALLHKNLHSYLNKTYPNHIRHVAVGPKKIQITGDLVVSKNVYLAEVSPYEHLTEMHSFEFLTPIKTDQKEFEITVKRSIKRHGFKQDRVLSKWVLVQKNNKGAYEPISHARYADTIAPKYTYPFIKPATKKGLGGYSANRKSPISDLDDLGISSVTVNILIASFFRHDPAPQNIPFEYMGKTYYVNRKLIENYDKTFRTTSERNIEVSAILLVDKASKAKDPKIGKLLQHPDCDPAGIYSMPNLTTPEGIQYYAAVLDFIAARYSRPDKKYGRIHHYIIHNEVDVGWVWTNAGTKSDLVYMDLYHKSMRISYNIARKYNVNSKVFISLTHYWNWTSNPKFYLSKTILEQLLQFSKAEGDFDWAIAHHPYPESLFEPKTWLDKKVSFSFDSELITFKNLEVLDAWVKKPEVLYKGKTKRLVYLSENGTNAMSYSDQDLKEQAAGMAYAMKKLNFLDGIDGFQYHNWQDNRKEGGLRIGLRKFPDDEKDPGGIKPVWKVYQAFGTDKENAVFDPYKSIIGIENWEDIHYKETIKTQNNTLQLNN